MSSIKIKTPAPSENIQTFLLSDYVSGTTLNVVSSTDFVNGQYIVVGDPFVNNTEITHLTSAPPDNNNMLVASLKFSHPAGTPVAYIDWDKYELSYQINNTAPWIVYDATNGMKVAMPDNLFFDDQYKEYRDSAATATYQWRYRYYSSEKQAYSDYSDIIGTTGWPRKAVGYMIKEIREIVNDPEEKTVKDIEILRFLNAAQDKVFSLYDRWWFLLKFGTPILTVTGQKTYPLPSDFGRMKNVEFEYVFGATDVTYNLRYLSMDEFDYETRDNTAANDDSVKYYSIYPADANSTTGYLRIWPKPLTAGLNITPLYYQIMPDLSSYASTTLIPIPDILENYALSQILKIRKEDDKAAAYDAIFKEQIQLLKLMQRKSARGGRSLWVYKGVNAQKRMYGTRDVYSDLTKEQYF